MLFRKHKLSQTSAIQKYNINNQYTLMALEDNKNLISDNQKYILAIWEIIYGDVKKGRNKLLEDILNNHKPIKVKIKYLVVSLFSRIVINKYYYYNPFRRSWKSTWLLLK